MTLGILLHDSELKLSKPVRQSNSIRLIFGIIKKYTYVYVTLDVSGWGMKNVDCI